MMKETYDILWKEYPFYRNISPAEDLVPLYLTHFSHQIKKGERLLDFGCGTGRAAKAFLSAGLSVELIDFSSHCLDEEIVFLTRCMSDRCRFWEASLFALPQELLAGEWGLCCDVLEHIPSEKVDAVLEQISSRILRGALFSIFLEADDCGPAIGKSLHLTVRPVHWWQKVLERVFPHVQLLLKTESNAIFDLASSKRVE